MIKGEMPDWRQDPFAILRIGFEKDMQDREDKRKEAKDKIQIVGGTGLHVEQSVNDVMVSKVEND